MSVVNHLANTVREWQFRLEKVAHPLKSVALEVTNRCDLRCLHCYARAGESPAAKDLSFKQIKTFADSLRQTFGSDLHVCLTGGEPLLRGDLIEIMDYLKLQGFKVSLATSGVQMTKEMASALAARLSGISISLDGLEPAHNFLRGAPVFTNAVDAIQMLKAAQVPYLAVKTSVFRQNQKDLGSLHSLIREWGADLWHVFPVEPRGRASQNQSLLLSHKEYEAVRTSMEVLAEDRTIPILFGEEQLLPPSQKSGQDCSKCCRAGITQFAVLSDGSVVSCLGADHERATPAGNILTGDIAQIWDDGFQPNRCKSYRICGNHPYENNPPLKGSAE